MRTTALLVPLATAFATGLLVSQALPARHGALPMGLRYVLTLAASLAAFFVVDRLARRLLPLAVLLRLTLSFPDRAPSRLAVALGASSRARLDAALAGRDPEGTDDHLRDLVTLAAALNSHDRRTRGHCERTRALAELLAEELHLSEVDTERLRWIAFLHDIGKLNVPAPVLNKAGPLTTAERNQITRHPIDGASIAAPLRGWLGDWVDGIAQHHERFDGSGYPDGLAGDQICLAGRITAVVDSFECMTAVRSYNRPKNVEDARSELVRCAGTDYDPRLVRAFLSISIGRVRWRVGLAAWIAELPFIGIPTRAAAAVVTRAAVLQPTANAAAAALLVTVAGVATPALAPATAAAHSSDGAPGGPSAPLVNIANVGATTATIVTTASSPGASADASPPDPGPHRPGNEAGNAPDSPGHSRITPGRDGVLPPGHGGIPPGHTGTKH